MPERDPSQPAMHTSPATTPQHSRWRWAGALLALLLGSQLMAYCAHWPWLYWLVAWPGTVLHEASHWISAWLLQGQPSQFNVWPDWTALWGNQNKPAGAAYSLGSVQLTPNWYNSASIALAPLLLWPLSAAWLWLAMRASRWQWTLAWLYLAASTLSSAWPSGVDWQVAWQAPTSWPLALALSAASAWLSWRIVRRWWQLGRPGQVGGL